MPRATLPFVPVIDHAALADLRERLRLLKAALRPGEALTDKDGPTVQGLIASAVTKLERQITRMQMG